LPLWRATIRKYPLPASTICHSAFRSPLPYGHWMRRAPSDALAPSTFSDFPLCRAVMR
jgi:hypothetical protein